MGTLIIHICFYFLQMWKNIYEETLQDTTFAASGAMASGLPLISISSNQRLTERTVIINLKETPKIYSL